MNTAVPERNNARWRQLARADESIAVGVHELVKIALEYFRCLSTLTPNDSRWPRPDIRSGNGHTASSLRLCRALRPVTPHVPADPRAMVRVRIERVLLDRSGAHGVRRAIGLPAGETNLPATVNGDPGRLRQQTEFHRRSSSLRPSREHFEQIDLGEKTRTEGDRLRQHAWQCLGRVDPRDVNRANT